MCAQESEYVERHDATMSANFHVPFMLRKHSSCEFPETYRQRSLSADTVYSKVRAFFL